MEEKIWDVIDILADYETTVAEVMDAIDKVHDDPQCDDDTKRLAEALLISVILNKAETLAPIDEQAWQDMTKQAEGLEQVKQLLFGDAKTAPLLWQVSLGYAVALSQTRWGWTPWNQVRQLLLEEEGDGEDQESAEPKIDHPNPAGSLTAGDSGSVHLHPSPGQGNP